MKNALMVVMIVVMVVGFAMSASAGIAIVGKDGSFEIHADTLDIIYPNGYHENWSLNDLKITVSYEGDGNFVAKVIAGSNSSWHMITGDELQLLVDYTSVPISWR